MGRGELCGRHVRVGGWVGVSCVEVCEGGVDENELVKTSFSEKRVRFTLPISTQVPREVCTCT